MFTRYLTLDNIECNLFSDVKDHLILKKIK